MSRTDYENLQETMHVLKDAVTMEEYEVHERDDGGDLSPSARDEHWINPTRSAAPQW